MREVRVVFITDPARDDAETVAVVTAAGRALGPGGLLVQMRDKASARDLVVARAHALREATRSVGALFVMNTGPDEPVDLARACGADGVHFPQVTEADVLAARAALGRGAIVTASAHTDDDVERASASGATAVLVSPIFDTPGKGPARGTLALVRARATVDAARRTPPLAIYALGGITSVNAAACRASGADGVAVVRALYDDAAMTQPWP